ncbi:hypothetical protein MTO96_014561 [Rhipicephalus appendiculatus]
MRTAETFTKALHRHAQTALCLIERQPLRPSPLYCSARRSHASGPAIDQRQSVRELRDALVWFATNLVCTCVSIRLNVYRALLVLSPGDRLAEMHSRSKHYSHRLRSGAGRSVRAPDPSEPSPYFDNSTSRNVTTSAGKAVFLPCKVRHLGDRTVSWIRRRDLHVLTVGRFTYTSDQRFQAIHMDNSDLWMLQIQYPQKKDAGMYECQVSTLPKISRFIALNVIVSKASIAGGPTLYLNSGSTLNLTCEVMESPVPPDYVFWYHDARVINYDIQHGVSVQTEKSPRTQSRLLIANAQPHDSGNYSCVPSNAEPASIVVHVLNGENPAAMQHGKHPSAAMCARSAPFTLFAVALCLQVCSRRR